MGLNTLKGYLGHIHTIYAAAAAQIGSNIKGAASLTGSAM